MSAWARVGVAAILVTPVVLIASVGTASAHHPEIVAEADCEAFVIRYTATAWDSPVPDSRHNNQVVISLDGVDVDSGQFTAANNYTFSGEIPATPGTHTVRATAAVQWGVNEDRGFGGEWRETTVDVPEDCVPPTTTAPPTTAPSTTAPTTTEGPTPETPTTSLATTTTTIPTEVEGEIEVSPPAQPVPGQPSFTG